MSTEEPDRAHGARVVSYVRITQTEVSKDLPAGLGGGNAWVTSLVGRASADRSTAVSSQASNSNPPAPNSTARHRCNRSWPPPIAGSSHEEPTCAAIVATWDSSAVVPVAQWDPRGTWCIPTTATTSAHSSNHCRIRVLLLAHMPTTVTGLL